MEIVNIDPKILVSYYKNAKKHDTKQIKNISKSIKKYGFLQPVVIDSDNVIVVGHGRVLGAIKAKLEQVPCLYAYGLTDEQIKEYRILDNKLSESEWDMDLLKFEVAELDFSDFELDFEFQQDAPVEDYKQTKNLENHFKADFETNNEWGIPLTSPYVDDFSNCEFVSFGEKSSIKSYDKTIIHFYIDDYKFNTLWENPDKYIDLFLKCKAVVSPDFSNYTDMPKAMHLWSQYKRQWLANYWQQQGVNIISSLSWGQGMIYDFTFAGIPQNTTVATSFVCDALDYTGAIEELKQVIDMLKPKKIFIKTAEKNKNALLEVCDCEFIKPYEFKGGGSSA